MNLPSYLKKFNKNEKLNNVKYAVLNKVLEHRDLVDAAVSFSRSISGFAETRSALSFVEGGVGLFQSITKMVGGYSDDYFSPDNQWHNLTYVNTPLHDILSSVLNNFTPHHMKFAYEIDPALVYTIPIGKIAKTKRGIYYKSEEKSKNEVLEYLILEKIKSINSNCFSIVESISTNKDTMGLAIKYDLAGETLRGLHSATSRREAEEIKHFLDRGSNRAIIFNGCPGAGKSVAAQSIVELLNLRTLKFYYRLSTDLNIIVFLIKALKIEAVIMDDFAPFSDNAQLLNLLEWMHQNVKLVIATTNSLKPFHPAVTRPQRFDIIREMNCLDEAIVREVLGPELFEQIGEKVAKWPIAFIIEIKERIAAVPDLNVNENIKELDKRVKAQMAALKA